MTDAPEQTAVLARLDELVAILRRVETRLQELVETRGGAQRLGPLVGGEPDVGPPPRRWDPDHHLVRPPLPVEGEGVPPHPDLDPDHRGPEWIR